MNKVSFVIPLYNGANSIEATLKSIYAQECCADFEVIVVNNNSHDDFEEIVKQFPCQLIHCKEQGRSFARNLGIQVATSPYIAFVDCDVQLTNTWLTESLKVLECGIIDACSSQIIPIGKKNFFTKFRFEYKEKIGFNSLHAMRINFPLINTAACLYRRELLNELGGFSTELNYLEDLDLSNMISYRGGAYADNNKAIAYVSNETGYFGAVKRAFYMGQSRLQYVKMQLFYLDRPVNIWKIMTSPLKEALNSIFSFLRGDFTTYRLIITSLRLSDFIGRCSTLHRRVTFQPRIIGQENRRALKNFWSLKIGEKCFVYNAKLKKTYSLNDEEKEFLLGYLSGNSNFKNISAYSKMKKMNII